MTHLALDPLISAARSHLSPSLPEAQSFLPRQAGTPCVKRLQSRDRADVSPYSRGPALVQESSVGILTSQPGPPRAIPWTPESH